MFNLYHFGNLYSPNVQYINHIPKPFVKEEQEKGNLRGEEKKRRKKLIIYTQVTEHLKIHREIFLKDISQTTTGKTFHIINVFLLCFIDTHLWNL